MYVCMSSYVLCMYLCMYVCMYVCMYSYVCICMRRAGLLRIDPRPQKTDTKTQNKKQEQKKTGSEVRDNEWINSMDALFFPSLIIKKIK